MVKDVTSGPMVLNTMASSTRMTFTVVASTSGAMVEFILVNGRKTKWTVKVFSPGLTVNDMKESMSRIRKKDMEFFHILMAGNSREIGGMGSSTVR